MTHVANHKQFGEGFGGSSLDEACDECLDKVVGGLDDKNFQLLAGLTRREFEIMLQNEYDHSVGQGLYNFWDGIMGMKALKAFARKNELQYRVKDAGRA